MILVLGPNPAWQKVLTFGTFRADAINRAGKRLLFASGKGVNFCRAARCHGGNHTELFQFAGGDNGRNLTRALEQEHFRHHTIELAAAETRMCTTCLSESDGTITELIEPPPQVSPAELRKLLDAVKAAVPQAALIAFCGTLPPGAETLYAEVARTAAAAGKMLLIDSVVNLAQLLELGGRQAYLKINAEELRDFSGETDCTAAFRRLFARYQLRGAAITAGAGNALFSDGETLVRYELPRLKKVVNPIGCGDTASAVFAAELRNGAAPQAAFQTALGAAIANCLSPICGEFTPETAQQYARAIQCTQEKL